MTTQSITSKRTPKQGKQFKRFVEDAGDRGLAEVDPDKDAIQRLIGRGGKFQAYLIAGIRRFTAKLPDYEEAQAILGTELITPEEVMKVRLGVVYTDEQLTYLAETMPSEEDLQWCRSNGYVVMPAPPEPIALLPVRSLKADHFYLKTDGWYADSKFASSDKTRRGWLALRKEPVPNSFSKTWEEQNKLVSDVEEVPNAAEMAWFITTYFEVRASRLFENVYVRTSSVDSNDIRVCVGSFDRDGLDIYDWWDDDRDDHFGVSAARKFK